jgi:aerobic carbon-monoxide dehydrogenase medium subunit
VSVAQITTYHRPRDVAAAWSLLAGGGDAVRLLAGGTDLVVRCPAAVRELVDLTDAGLDGVTTLADGRLRLGATTTFTELLETPEVRAYGTGVVGEMLGQLGSVLHRNSATIGGHVARARMSDVVPVLLALDATVVVYDGSEHERPLVDLLAGPPGVRLVTAVVLPASPRRSAAAFVRFSRTTFDHALLNASCRIELDEDGLTVAARVVVGEPAILGRRLPAPERSLLGRPPGPQPIADAARATRDTITCRDDPIASAEYRRHLAGVAVERCLATAVDRLPGGAG